MVGKKSEYQKQFSTTVLSKHIPIYEANLECRHRRRDQQFAHTSIAWDSDTSSEDDVKNMQNKFGKLVLEKEEIYPSIKSSIPPEVKADTPSKSDKSTSANLSNNDNHNISTAVQPVIGKVEKLDLGKTRIISSGKKRIKVKRPDRTHKIPKHRPASAPSKPTNTIALEGRIPFVSYGAGDGDNITGVLWTHNVRADSQVYPSALRAQKNREHQAKKREEKYNKYVWLTQRKKKAILDLMKKETADWETEYQKHYPAYDKIIYERALSARPDSSCRREY